MHAFQPTGSMRRASAFTLVELLAVVAIIAILIALLMPALTLARQHAARVKCAAHLGQIGLAVAMYANEQKGSIPVAYSYPVAGWLGGYHWTDHLAPYLRRQTGEHETVGDRDLSVLWGCPLWDGIAEPMQNEYWGKAWKVGYGYNCLPLLPDRPTMSFKDSMLINLEIGHDGRYFKLCEIMQHSDRGMAADASDVYIGIPYPWDPSAPMGRQQYGNMSPTRHGRWGSAAGVNALFYDGHVAGLSARDAYYAFHDPARTETR